MKVVCFLLLSLAIVYANVFSYEEGVLVLTTSNFEQAISEFDYTLVKFYAPWCGYCKRLAPEYQIAAQELAQSHPQIKLAKVDATVETALAEKYEVKSYPTIMFFIKGAESPVEFDSKRTAQGIIDWLMRKTGDLTHISKELDVLEDIKNAVGESETTVLFVGPSDLSHKNYAEYVRAATEIYDIAFLSTNNEEIKSQLEVEQDTMIVLPDHGEEEYWFTGPFDSESIKAFIEAHKLPTIKPLTENIAQFLREKQTALILLVGDNEASKEAEAEFRAVAAEGKDLFILFVGKYETDIGKRAARYLGVNEADLPAIRIVQPSIDMRKYIFDQEITGENIRNFINDFRDNKLKPFFRSEPVPEEPYDGPVRVLVGTNYNEVVKDETKDVFVELYAPWCDFCVTVAPKYRAFAEKLKDVENLVIAKMDVTANEAEGVSIVKFPTLLFYPRDKKNAPVELEENASETYEQGLVDFVRKHATVPVPEVIFEKETQAQDQDQTQENEQTIEQSQEAVKQVVEENVEVKPRFSEDL